MSSARPTRPRRIVRTPRLSAGPCAARPRRGSTSREALANSTCGSGRTSILSGRAINQASFLNVQGDEAPVEQKSFDVAPAHVDRLCVLGEEAAPEGQIAF